MIAGKISRPQDPADKHNAAVNESSWRRAVQRAGGYYPLTIARPMGRCRCAGYDVPNRGKAAAVALGAVRLCRSGWRAIWKRAWIQLTQSGRAGPASCAIHDYAAGTSTMPVKGGAAGGNRAGAAAMSPPALARAVNGAVRRRPTEQTEVTKGELAFADGAPRPSPGKPDRPSLRSRAASIPSWLYLGLTAKDPKVRASALPRPTIG